MLAFLIHHRAGASSFKTITFAKFLCLPMSCPSALVPLCSPDTLTLGLGWLSPQLDQGLFEDKGQVLLILASC